MPRLNLLRAHRRTHTTQPTSTTSTPTPASVGPPPLDPSVLPPACTSSTPPTLSALPPLDIGSPNLGSPGRWLTHEPSASTFETTAPTPALSMATTNFSRNSSPHTELSTVRPTASLPPAQLTKPIAISVAKEKSKESKKEKLGRLNPMSLLRRRTSQAQLALEKERQRARSPYGDLPEDFDPKIIYGTRHPDWSSHPKRGSMSDVRSLSPVPVAMSPSSPGFIAEALSAEVSGEASAEGIDARLRQGHRKPDSESPMPVSIGENLVRLSLDRNMPDKSPSAPLCSPPLIPAQGTPLAPLNSPPPPPVPGPGTPDQPLCSPPPIPVPPTPSEPLHSPPPPSVPHDLVSADGGGTTQQETEAMGAALGRPSSALSFGVQDGNEGELHDNMSTENGRRRRVTLVDHPLASPHHAIANSSKFSFEGSSAPSPASSVKKQSEHKVVDCDDEDEIYDFDFDLDDDEDDGFGRANEGMFDNEFDDFDSEKICPGSENYSSNDNDQYIALQAAVQAMDLGNTEKAQGIGLALTSSLQIQTDPMGLGLGLSGMPAMPATALLPKMDSQPAPSAAPPSPPPPVPQSDATTNPKLDTVLPRTRLSQLANPRNLDLSDNSDLEDSGNGLAGYEDGSDDDLYYDDGIITAAESDYPPQPPAPAVAAMETRKPQALTLQPPTTETTPEPTPQFINQDSGYPQSPPTSPPIPAAPDMNRFSVLTSSGGALIEEDGSMATNACTDPQTFPPFINPVGSGGLGYTPSHPQFYAPNVSGTMLNGMALSSLTYTLQQYQLQQAAAAEGTSPIASDLGEMPHFGEPHNYENDFMDDYDDDEMVAAANSEALASDADGFYSSEFGFYPSATGTAALGGFFGAAGGGELLRPPIRRPSLTPISERSENSYRNSLVFPVPPWSPVDDIAPDMRLSQLMQLRRNAWGGSNGSLRSNGTGGGSGGASPIPGAEMYAGPAAGLGMASPGLPPGLPQGRGSSSPMGFTGGGMMMGGMGVGVGYGTAPPPPAPPPGLSHAGSRAMLPTKGSFEDQALNVGVGVTEELGRVKSGGITA